MRCPTCQPLSFATLSETSIVPGTKSNNFPLRMSMSMMSPKV